LLRERVPSYCYALIPPISACVVLSLGQGWFAQGLVLQHVGEFMEVEAVADLHSRSHAWWDENPEQLLSFFPWGDVGDLTGRYRSFSLTRNHSSAGSLATLACLVSGRRRTLLLFQYRFQKRPANPDIFFFFPVEFPNTDGQTSKGECRDGLRPAVTRAEVCQEVAAPQSAGPP